MHAETAKILKNVTKERPCFKYFDKGSLATIGVYKAVGFFRKITFSGLIAWAVWIFIHIAYLVDFRNRFSVLVQWYFQLLSGTRGARVIQNTIEEDSQKP